MGRIINIGVIGDYDEGKVSHPATDAAIRHAADSLSVAASVAWLPTRGFLAEKGGEDLMQYDAIWASSGSPYRSMEGAINGIRLARESGRPFFAT
jgi:CTP synthase (UTP-ammonia lyase)